MLDRPHPRTLAGLRQKRSRARRKRGLLLLPVEIDEHALVEALNKSTRISGDEGLDRHRLAKEVAAIVDDFIERWSGGETGRC
jgi:hypothetical protein